MNELDWDHEARRLLQELCEQRDQLVRNLTLASAAGNLMDKSNEFYFSQLGAFQGCIAATREFLDKLNSDSPR